MIGDGINKNEMSLIENSFHLACCLLCLFFYNTDALVPSCDEQSESCSCHPSYEKYYEKLQGRRNLTNNCLKVFNRKLDWNSAYRTCEKEYSFVLQSLQNDDLYKDLKRQGIELIWIGMKRISGFYVNVGSNEPSIFKETNRDWGRKWSPNEPVRECVALDLSSESLVTTDCTTELHFVCQNSGLPKYPVRGSLACSDDWLLFYHLPVSRKKCLKIVESSSLAEANRTCSSAGGDLADLALHVYMNSFAGDSRKTPADYESTGSKPKYFFQFGAPDLWDKSVLGSNSTLSNSTESCENSTLLSLLGPEVSKHLNFSCSDKLFICERGTTNVSLSVRITPAVPDAFPSSHSSLLTCEIASRDRDVDGASRKHVLYEWHRNGIPISVGSRLAQVGFYDDPTKLFNWKANEQGTYRCGARVAGLADTYYSEEIDYFYSDVSTYILTVQGDSGELKYRDFSQIGFRSFKYKLMRSMDTFTKNLTTDFPHILWDFQSFSLNGNVSTVKLLLYIKRNESLYVQLNSEKEIYERLKKYVGETRFVSSIWSRNSLSLQSADVCHSEVVRGASHDGDLVWKESLQTKTAMSEPLCLNGWKLVTRECKPSLVVGAEWQPFNYSSCSKYQTAVTGPKTNCPDGFRELSPNLCFSVNNEGHTYDEADEICKRNSSYLVNLRIFNSFTQLEQPDRVWISGKFASSNVRYSGMDLHLLKPPSNFGKSAFHCASAVSNKWFYNISMENCKKEMSFICIHQPIKLVSLIKLSVTWSRLSNQTSCFNLSSASGTWAEARDACPSLSGGSTLLQSIHRLGDYLLFKLFMHSIVTSHTRGAEWWMGLAQDQDSVGWPEMDPLEFVDWNGDTDFGMRRSAGVVNFDRRDEVRWGLRDPSAQTRYVCELKDCPHQGPTVAYIEDHTITKGANHTASLQRFELRCVPSGWFVARSVSWYKDGIPLSLNSDSSEFGFRLTSEAGLEDVLPFQGYYWCSVEQERPLARVDSAKVLFRIPGLHAFVLYMQSPDLFVDVTDCSDYMKNFIVPPAFVDHLSETIYGFQFAVLRNLTCERSGIHYYIHIYVEKHLQDEDAVMTSVESAVLSSIDVINAVLDGLHIDRSNFSLRSTVACPEEKVTFSGYTTTWPSTLIGQSAQSKELCISEKENVVERMCLGDFNTGAHWGPVQQRCDNSAASARTLHLHKLSKVEITKDNIFNLSLEMEMLTAESLSSADVQYVAQILKNMATLQDIQTKVLSSVINTVDNIIGVELLRSSDLHSNISSKISFAMDSMLSNLDTNGQVFQAAGSNIAVSVFPNSPNITLIQTGGILESWSSNLTTLFNGTGRTELYSGSIEAGILLPVNMLASAMGDELAIAVHKNIHRVGDVRVVSPIVDVSIGSRTVFDVDPPIEMIFKVPEVRAEEGSLHACVFWDQSLRGNYGGWSRKGCLSSPLDTTHVRCSCDHLTSFAVILELRPGSQISEVHQKTLSNITYVGCALSIFGLGVIILTFVIFRQWRKGVKHKALFNLSLALFSFLKGESVHDITIRQWRKDVKHKALFNLSLALFSFLLIFVAGVEKVKGESVLGCMAVAALLHYFMLASFAWMLVEAFMQYLSLVKVIGTYIPRFMQKAVLFGWGMPLIIVGIMLSINYKLYSSKHQYCWVSDRAFFYAVAGPVLAMLLLNFLIFSLILYSNTCGRPHKYLRTNQNERRETVARAKAVFCVSILLGLSWIFGFLAVEGAKLVFQYLFAITTTLQGFFIFIFFVVRQRSTRSLWLGLLRPSSTPEISRLSHITGGTEVPNRALNPNRTSRAVFRASKSYVSFNG